MLGEEDLIEAMIDAVVVIGLGGEVTLTNGAAVDLSGYSREELLALSVGQLFDDAVSGVRTRVRQKIAAGEPLRREEAWLVTKSGSRIPVSIMASPILRDETPVAIVLVARDARETRRLLVERDAELARRREAETQLNTLAGGVGHELRNIAQVQVNSIEVLQHALSTGADLAEPVTSILHDLERVSDHLVLHARHLMHLARPQREALERLSPTDLIADVVKMLERDGRLRGIELALAPSDPVLGIMVSRARLEQVLVNLILNGAESITPPGTISIGVAVIDQRLEITVKDSGAGIPPELVDRIFEPYFTTKGEGTGLGLSIVRDIIEGYGGKLIVESVVGVGTTFRFDLPLAPQTTVPS